MQIFINNKYTKIYYQIIEMASQSDYTGIYTEKHHIIPRALGGNNNAENLIVLTARQHFICHRLLPKMTQGISKRKMTFALNQMLCSNKYQKRVVTSAVYAHIKEEFNKINHFNNPEWQRNNAIKNKGKTATEEARQNMRKGWEARRKKGLGNPGIGRKHSEETRKKISENRKGKCAGKENSFYGKTHTDEMKEHFKTRPQNINPPWKNKKKKCPHCARELDPGNYAQYHGDKCKSQI